MIIATSLEDAHAYGDIIPSIYKLRYQAFIARQNYDVPTYKNMEYDAYDTPATVYLAWRDNENVVRGCTRLSPTDRPYMIKDIWPETVTSVALPHSPDVWEASRFCIDKHLPTEQRRRIHGELLCAFQEFCLHQDIKWMIGVMSHPIWRFVFIKNGWPIEYLGPPKTLDNEPVIIAGKMPVSLAILERLRNVFNIYGNVLDCNTELFFQKVA